MVIYGYLPLRSVYGTENSSQQMSMQCSSTFNMVFSDEDKILIKKFVFEGVHSKEALTEEFSEKCWTKSGVDKLIKTLRNTDTVYGRPEIWIFNFRR